MGFPNRAGTKRGLRSRASFANALRSLDPEGCMRIVSVVTFLALTTVLSASAAEEAQSATSVTLSPNLPIAFEHLHEQRSASLTSDSQPVRGSRRSGPTENYNDSVCATMRTYVVARTHPESDATRVVGYSRCQPAWKFQIRTADKSVEGSSPR